MYEHEYVEPTKLPLVEYCGGKIDRGCGLSVKHLPLHPRLRTGSNVDNRSVLKRFGSMDQRGGQL